MRLRLAFILLLIGIGLASLPARAGIVTGIIDSNTLQIDLTHRVRIANILAPPAIAAKLQAVLLNQLVTLSDSRTDATGTASASVTRADGTDLAGELVAAGLARVYPLSGRDPLPLIKLLAVEAEARTRKLGLWADPAFAVQPPEQAGRLLNSYGIVEGTVVAAASVKGRYYLNFGTDWKSDFTVQLTRESIAALALPPAKLDWLQLQGKRIRVRGWIEARNGPMLMLTSPTQLELIND